MPFYSLTPQGVGLSYPSRLFFHFSGLTSLAKLHVVIILRRRDPLFFAGSPCHRYTRRGGTNKAGTLKIHRAADRRQAAGRSSRAEYSEVPGIVGPLSGSDGSFFVILPDRRSAFYGEKRPPGRPGQAPQSHRRWRCRIRTCYPFRR